MPDTTLDILLVEDSADDAAFVRHALKETDPGVRLHLVQDGAEALKFLFGSTAPPTEAPLLVRPRLILLDLKLPKVSGLELLHRIKGNSHTRAIPVVVLSSSQEVRDLTDSYDSNVNSYLVKPMDFDEFGELVQMVGRYWLRLNQSPKP